jgi:hypothetical protein
MSNKGFNFLPISFIKLAYDSEQNELKAYFVLKNAIFSVFEKILNEKIMR